MQKTKRNKHETKTELQADRSVKDFVWDKATSPTKTEFEDFIVLSLS